MKRTPTRRAKTAPTTPKQAFLAALEGGRNEHVKGMFAELLERCEMRRDEESGRWEAWCRLGGEYLERLALGLSAWDHNEHTAALTTHDLSSFVCRDVAGLVGKLRIA